MKENKNSLFDKNEKNQKLNILEVTVYRGMEQDTCS
jgi:hypothetical protein